jgi:hypothetical protein
MRNNTVNVLAGIQPGQALAPRGGALRTFGGLALLLAVAFLALGTYLIEDEITNPHPSQSLGLFAAAFLLASAMALIHELIQLPRNTWRSQARAPAVAQKAEAAARSQRQANNSIISNPNPATLTSALKKSAAKLADSLVPRMARRPSPTRVRLERCKNLPYQRCYVDPVRVRA